MAKKKKILKKKNLVTKPAKKPKKILVAKKKITIIHKKKNKSKPLTSAKKKKKISVKKISTHGSKKILRRGRGQVAKKTVSKKILRHSLRQVAKKNKKSVKPALGFDVPGKSLFKANIRVIGIGGGGGSIVSEIGKSLHKASFVIADTDARAFKKKQGIKYFLFGQELTHGLGTGVNPDLARLAAEQSQEKISHLFDGQDIVIFIASLGGGVGSGATKIFLEAAKNFADITFGIFTLPFKFEGKNKTAIALKSLAQLRNSLNVSLTIPNEKIFKVIGEHTPITSAFSVVNKSLIESLESLIDLIYAPGIINIDFADVKAILKGRGNLAFLNTAQGSGKDRAQTVAEKILHNPLYQTNTFTGEKILFNIAGGADLSMFEVNIISKAISEVNPQAKIIFGISKNPADKHTIKTTLLMTGADPKAKPEPARKVLRTVAQAPKTVASIVKKTPAVKKPEPAEIVKITKPKKISSQKRAVKKVRVPARRRGLAAEPLPLRQADIVAVDQSSLDHPVFDLEVKNSGVAQAPMKIQLQDSGQALAQSWQKKAIRRSALEIKKAQEEEEQKQSLQEKEWEIPAFMRIKK